MDFAVVNVDACNVLLSPPSTGLGLGDLWPVQLSLVHVADISCACARLLAGGTDLPRRAFTDLCYNHQHSPSVCGCLCETDTQGICCPFVLLIMIFSCLYQRKVCDWCWRDILPLSEACGSFKLNYDARSIVTLTWCGILVVLHFPDGHTRYYLLFVLLFLFPFLIRQ